MTELPPAVPTPQADSPPPPEPEPPVHLGEIACSGGALALQILFREPALEAGKWLESRIGQAQDKWRAASEDCRLLAIARESVMLSEAELSTVTHEADSAKRDWELALESGGDYSSSESAYAELQTRARMIEQRLAVQRSIVKRRHDGAIAAWRVEFTKVVRAERERLEGHVHSLRRVIARHIPAEALEELRQVLTVGVPVAMGQVDDLRRCI